MPFERIKREILERKKEEANPALGCYPDKRPIEKLIQYGVVNIDKPSGPTSHQVSDYVQKILNIKKSGHSGTLDPGVTGVLPIALEKATRVVQVLLLSGKGYIALMHLHKKVGEQKIKENLMKFVGKIKQIPPLKSAVKRVKREREVYYIEILDIEGQDVLFRVGCQAGTYIRKLIHDFGLKVGGAHMAELRRTKAGPFGESTLFTLQDLADAFYYYKKGNEKFLRKVIQPMENAVAHLPKIWVLDSAVDSVCHGANLNIPGIAKLESGIEEGNNVAVLTLKGELVAIGIANKNSEEILNNEKGLAVKAHKVFMEPGIYKLS